MYNHILVPLDGSAISEEALEEARAFVSKGAQITLVTAVNTPELPARSFDMYGGVMLTDVETQHQMEDWAREYLDSHVKLLADEGFVSKRFVEVGEPAQVIAEVAAREHVGAIVISTHGRSGVSRWLFGSVTNKVLNIAPCPVLVVPSREKLRLMEKSTPEAFYG
jgi:nucleotide-binding universal stress UspA family protein